MRIRFILFAVFVLSVPLPSLFSADEIARVAKTSGTVQLRRLDETAYSEIKQGQAIQSGDFLRVGSPGFCLVVFLDDKSILKIREETEFQFVETENTRTIDIDFGTILSDIKRERKKGFRMQTPVSVASVKGTQWWSVVNRTGFDRFYGLEGEVEVFNSISGQTVSLGPGQMVLSTATGQLVSAPATPEEIPKDPEEEEVIEEEEEEIPEEEVEEEVEPEEVPEPEPVEEVEEVPEPEAMIEEELFEEEEIEEEAEEPVEEPTPEAPKPFNMGLGIGSATIDGVLYNQLALRPEFRIGKLGIGLDLVLYVDNEGNIRRAEWDEASDVIDKFLYVRWAEKSDPFWFKLGALDGVTLGYGGILSGYSNMMEFPSVRRVGLNFGANVSTFGGEIFLANVKDFARGGTLLGLRGTFTLSEKIPLTLGANLVTDINQFSGMKDRDDDSFPDIFDDFPDSANLWNDTDGDGIPDPHSGVDSSRWDIDADGDNYYDYDPLQDTLVELKPQPFSLEENRSRALGFAFDIGYPVVRSKALNLLLYAEFNQLSFPAIDSSATFSGRPERTGTGITIPGIRARLLGFLDVSLEYRLKNDYFVPQFFDQAYDLNRVLAVYGEDGAEIFTKDMLVFADSASILDTKGYFGSAGFDLLNLVNFKASYANMVADTIEFNSFFAFLSLNPENIPKLSEAAAYYQRNNDPDPFDFKNPSVNTVLGYRAGYEISKGVSLVWDFRQFYRDRGTGLKAVRQTTIETRFTF